MICGRAPAHNHDNETMTDSVTASNWSDTNWSDTDEERKGEIHSNVASHSHAEMITGTFITSVIEEVVVSDA